MRFRTPQEIRKTDAIELLAMNYRITVGDAKSLIFAH
jgi:hypothetical protein